jgi:AraC-like DNA-binding protein
MPVRGSYERWRRKPAQGATSVWFSACAVPCEPLLVAEAVSGDEVARLLSMHRRTLNRRLREEGTTFQELLDEVRFEAACQFLDTSHIPITEIANSLGYAETSAFSRAFRRWSGASPVQRRRKSQSSAMRGAHRQSRTREAS